MALQHIVKKFSVFIFIVFLLSACTRIGSTEMGLGLLPSIDAFNTKDTVLEVITETVDRPDTLRIFSQDDQVVGNISNDPVFGSTTASMYFQLKPSFFPYSTRGNLDSVVVDSAVLILAYRGAYGDTSAPLTLNLRRVSAATPLFNDSLVASNYPELYNFQTDAVLANPYVVDFGRVRDSVINRFEAARNQIRIKLNNSFANLFLKVFDSNVYKNDTTFHKAFPGFVLTANAGSNVLIRINLLDTNTKLGLYYSTNATTTVAGKRDTVVDYFRFGLNYSASANFIKRNRAGSEVARHFGRANDSLIYVQTSPGTMVKIKVPALKNFANKIIHRAELIAEQVPDANSALDVMFPAPNYLFLGAYDSAKNLIRTVPNDFQSTANTSQFIRFGGYRINKSIQGFNNVATYNFDISRYMQGVISRKDSIFDLRIFAPVNDTVKFVPPYPNNFTAGKDYLTASFVNQPAIGRVRLGGGSHSKFRMRLRVYYSNL